MLLRRPETRWFPGALSIRPRAADMTLGCELAILCVWYDNGVFKSLSLLVGTCCGRSYPEVLGGVATTAATIHDRG